MSNQDRDDCIAELLKLAKYCEKKAEAISTVPSERWEAKAIAYRHAATMVVRFAGLPEGWTP